MTPFVTPPPLQVTGFNSWQIPPACLEQAKRGDDAAIAVFAPPKKVSAILWAPYNRPYAVIGCEDWSLVRTGFQRVARTQAVLQGEGLTSACVRRCP